MKTPNINTILRANPRSIKCGAPLGATSYNEGSGKCYLQRVVFTDGYYAPDGTYWGMPANLWCAFNGVDICALPASETRIYVRANTRKAAMQAVLNDYPEVKFYRG